MGSHGIRVGVPAIEIAHDGEALGIRRPDSEVRALVAIDLGDVRAQLFVELVVAALVKKMEVHAGEQDRTRVFALILGRDRFDGGSLLRGRDGLFRIRWSHGRVLLVAGVTRRQFAAGAESIDLGSDAPAKPYKSTILGERND